jgi:hypothetical protein
MAMKCPNCGAENPEYSFYCGTCAGPLKESEPTATSTTIHTEDDESRYRRELREALTLLSFICAFLAAVWILVAGDWGFQLAFFVMFLFGITFAAFFLVAVISGDFWRTSFTRPKGVSPEQSMQVRVIALRPLVVTSVLSATYIISLWLTISETGIRPDDLIGIVYIGAFILVLALSIPQRMHFDSEGVCIRPMLGKREYLFPRSSIESVNVSGRVLKVLLRKSAVPFPARVFFPMVRTFLLFRRKGQLDDSYLATLVSNLHGSA